MPIYSLGPHIPDIAASAFVAAEATLVGQVRLGEHSSVWFGAVIRADNEPIRIGASSNVQEGAVLHADPSFPLTVGERVTVGHQAMLHGCTIGDGSLIGIQAVVLNGAIIGKHCLVGAGAPRISERSGNSLRSVTTAPAKVVRTLSDEDVANLERSAAGYVQRAATFRTELKRLA